MLFKTLKQAAKSITANRSGAAVEYPLEIEQKLNELHGRAPLDQHLEMLFKNLRVGDEGYADLYRRCLTHTGTAVTPFNVFQRFQTRLDIVQYFLSTLQVPGARAECGVYRGATALLLCHAWRSRVAGYMGEDFYLIDSYAGTSASVEHDLIPVRESGGSSKMEPFFPVGKTDTSPELVRGFFQEFPNVRVCAGWIPRIFETLPECAWSFVHLDLTLFEPTYASFEYFYPRLSKGGVILCDGSIFCPGAAKAVEEFCARQAIPYVVLGHRTCVIVK